MREIDKKMIAYAAKMDIVNMVRCLDEGANVNAIGDGEDETALSWIAVATSKAYFHSNGEDESLDFTEEEKIEAMKILLERGADINLYDKGECGVNALYTAVVRANVKIVKFLLENGANPNINFFPDEDPHVISTVLDTAYTDEWLNMRGLAERHREIIKLLEQYGAVAYKKEK